MTGTALAQLAQRLYGLLRDGADNLCLSPLSIGSALALLEPGARGDTLVVLRRVLMPDSPRHFGALTRELATRAEPTTWHRQMVEHGVGQVDDFGVHVHIANQLWVQRGYPIATDYAAALAEHMGVDPAPVDFEGDPQGACDAINRWVRDATRERITSIADPRSLPELIRGMLANALYFRAGWMDSFEKTWTDERPFHLLDGGTTSVPMMRSLGYRRYAEVDGIHVVDLPYVRPELAMTLIVPPRERFREVDDSISNGRAAALVAAARESTYLTLRMPRFSFESAFQLVPALETLGLDALFDERADLSGVSPEPGFHVGSVLHKTFLAVDELGTEAAAVTAVAVDAAGMRPEPIEVEINRPFYAVIRDEPTGAWLFFARILDPGVATSSP